MTEVTKLKTRTAKKEWAQNELMHGMANVLGYWTEHLSEEERDSLGEDGIVELRALLQQQADRVAKIFGYEQAWSN